MPKLFETKTIAERQVSSEIIEALLSLEKYLEAKSNIFIQDTIDNEVTLQTTLVLTDMEDSNNDELVLKLKEKTDNEFLLEIVDLISACKSAREHNFDNLTIYHQ